jgi:hypothetical protein
VDTVNLRDAETGANACARIFTGSRCIGVHGFFPPITLAEAYGHFESNTAPCTSILSAWLPFKWWACCAR